MFGWGVKTVTVDELVDKLAQGKQVLIDVREPYEFASGHLKGAVNVPLGQLCGQTRQVRFGRRDVGDLQSGHRSATAVRLLKRAGFENAYSVKGGTSAWRGRLVR